MAEFEKLRVGVLQQLNGGLRAGCRVVEKCRVPCDDGKVLRVVRDLRLEHFGDLTFRESDTVTAYDLCNLRAEAGGQLCARWRTGGVTDMEDEVIFAQPSRVRVLHSLRNAAQLLAN